ncbi:MAG TPA: nickel pincer cofactor biosynthesis protein LarB [Longimicrobiales bacterium]|nr:nickel pincer cofactor biosynthesis protein LarB [Longimicrobiales bacterium]
MTREQVLELLRSVAEGRETAAGALDRLAWLPVEPVGAGEAGDVAFARVDHHRALRQGYPEVVFAEGKTTEQVVEICRHLARRGGFLATRTDEATRRALTEAFPAVEVNALARTVHLPGAEAAAGARPGPILVVAAGTSDLPVAEEAVVTARALGNDVERLYDVGVAGLHRLLLESDALRRAAVVIVVAGMEGALASVVGGLVAAPVVAVPTSVGYGAAFGGLAALLGMLTSCAAGVTVVNIDNGFGAACAANRIVRGLLSPVGIRGGGVGGR